MSYVTFGPDRVTAEPELTPDQLINISSLSLSFQTNALRVVLCKEYTYIIELEEE